MYLDVKLDIGIFTSCVAWHCHVSLSCYLPSTFSVSFRLVNSVIEEEMKSIHAFTQKTLTPEQWEKQKS